METGHFYYINDKYFIDFPDSYFMCPITTEYIKNEYIDSATNIPVRINGALEKELKEKARKILALQRKGFKLIFPDVLMIEKALLHKSNLPSE